MTAEQIKEQYPMPWRHVLLGNGQIYVVDGAGKEVPLLTILSFVTDITARMATKSEPTKETT